jgi:branched-subunit amino acid ABC-type transport system permease component
LLVIDMLSRLAAGSLAFSRVGSLAWNGLMRGLVIGLAGVGLSMTYSTLNFANFAHGDTITAGAFSGWAVTDVIAGFGVVDIGTLALVGTSGSQFGITVTGTPLAVLAGAVFAGLLSLGPTFVGRIVDQSFTLGGALNTFTDAVAALASLEVTPLVAYALDSISTLRFVLLGVVLILLMQRRPEGLLGHRKETAAAVDLSRRSVSDGEATGSTRTDGGPPVATEAPGNQGGDDE